MSAIEITTYPTGAAFLDATQAWLLDSELERSLHYSLAQRHLDGKTLSGDQVFFGVARQAGEILIAAVRTPPWKVNLTGPPGNVAAATALVPTMLQTCPDLRGAFGPEALVEAFATSWRAATGDALEAGDAIALHRLDTLIPARGVSGDLRRPNADEIPLALAWMDAFHAEANPSAPRQEARQLQIVSGEVGEVVWLWDDAGTPVSMCFTTRDTPHGRCIAGVYTPPPLRGRGYASGLVSAVTQHTLDSGKSMPYLHTDRKNPTSNKIYAALGYRCIEHLSNITFVR